MYLYYILYLLLTCLEQGVNALQPDHYQHTVLSS